MEKLICAKCGYVVGDGKPPKIDSSLKRLICPECENTISNPPAAPESALDANDSVNEGIPKEHHTTDHSLLTECKKCKNILSKRALICPKCGAGQKEKCFVCQRDIPIDSAICPECGDPSPFEQNVIQRHRDKRPQNDIKPSPPENDRDGRFVVYENGIVKDTSTELEWLVGPDKDTTWDEAIAWVQSLKDDGGGWQMPGKYELAGLYNKGTGTRNMTALLKTTGWWVWSGKTKGSAAWHFSFKDDFVGWDDRHDSHCGRGFAVRSQLTQDNRGDIGAKNVAESKLNGGVNGAKPLPKEHHATDHSILAECPKCGDPSPFSQITMQDSGDMQSLHKTDESDLGDVANNAKPLISAKAKDITATVLGGLMGTFFSFVAIGIILAIISIFF